MDRLRVADRCDADDLPAALPIPRRDLPPMLTDLEREALCLSLQVAAWATLLCLPPAIGVAWLLSRSRLPGKALLEALVHAPLVLPPVVVGYLLLITLGTRAPLGRWLHQQFDIQLIFTTEGAVVAAAVMAFPLMVRAIRLSLEAVDRGLEVAARTLGAGRWDAFATVTLPLMLPGILSGCMMAFAASLGEFGATITFASNVEGETRTLPLAIYTATQTPDGDALALRLVALSMALALGALVLSGLLERRTRRWLGRA
ncbi:molybdate ABC transporter permease subunit [Caldimonas thermodepolymerans]|nr:molybdate ABC transporter permease subunit [Caldimonas thermodepolymerans]UZG49142.1 molybdate ABC transporter permease subunit [Caldimonas thermodepolymerans]